jgi:hypothetical protein
MLPTTGYSQEKKHEQYITFKDQKYASFSDKEVEKFLSAKPNFTVVANRFATTFVASKILKGSDVVDEVNVSLSMFLDLDPDKDNTKQIISFWNTYSKYLITTIEDNIGRTPEHVLKRAVSTNTHSEMFFKYLMRFGPGVIDFNNTIEIVDGKEETLIDYIDKIIASEDFEKNYNTSDVKKLRKGLTLNFNAKTASQLKN